MMMVGLMLMIAHTFNFYMIIFRNNLYLRGYDAAVFPIAILASIGGSIGQELWIKGHEYYNKDILKYVENPTYEWLTRLPTYAHLMLGFGAITTNIGEATTTSSYGGFTEYPYFSSYGYVKDALIIFFFCLVVVMFLPYSG